MSSVTFIATSERELLREISSILGQERCYVSRNVLRSCEVGLEAGSWHCSTLLERKDVERQGKVGLIIPGRCRLTCGKAPTRATVLRDIISGILCVYMCMCVLSLSSLCMGSVFVTNSA